MSRSPKSKNETPGYCVQYVQRFDGQNLEGADLLVPDHMLQEVLAQNADAVLAYEEVTAARMAKSTAERNRTTTKPSSTSDKPRSSAKKGGIDTATESEALLESYTRDLERTSSETPGQRVQVYDWAEPLNLLANGKNTPDSHLVERNESIFRKLAEKGCFRRIGSDMSLDAMAMNLQKLRQAHPHFSEVVELIQAQINLARLQCKTLHLPPLLLSGPPGVGKTHFALALQKALDRPLVRHGMDSDRGSSSLLGSERNWANTHPGIVFEQVCLSDRADPIVVLDEIDKAGRTLQYQDPLAPLHSLLEPLTAKRVGDISVGMSFDARHILWIATANNPSNLQESLLSRFEHFRIREPEAADAISMAQAIAKAVIEDLTVPSFQDPERSIALALAHLTPREQHQVLRQAVARAVSNGRSHLALHDLPTWTRDSDKNPGGNSEWLH